MSVFPSHYPGTGEDVIYAQLIQNTMDTARDAELKLEVIYEQVMALRDDADTTCVAGIITQSNFQRVLDLLKPEAKS